jgi:hypothetical protein
MAGVSEILFSGATSFPEACIIELYSERIKKTEIRII